jgi:hypothetical protein
MDHAVAIATNLANQLDIATQHIQQLKAELRESRTYAANLNEQLQQRQPTILITPKDIIEEMLADAADKHAQTQADDDFIVMMALQRKYDSM